MKTLQTEPTAAHSLKLEKPARPYYEPQNLYLAGARLAMKGLTKMSVDWAARVGIKMFSTPHAKSWHKEVPEAFKSAGQYCLSTTYGRIKIHSWGESGPRVLLVHGWESRAFTFATMVPALLERGFRVVAIDGPAHGESSGSSTNLVEFAQVIQTVIDHYELAGGISHIIAHSFGAAAVTYQFSGRSSDKLVSLVLISMPTQIKQVFQSFAQVLRLSDRVLDRMVSVIHQRTGVSIDKLDLGHRLGEAAF